MAEQSAIAWTTSTFNPWIGCTKVGPGCDGCYAETLDKRHKWGGATHWGVGVTRYRTSANLWKQPLLWDKKQAAALRAWDAGLHLVNGDEKAALGMGFIKPAPWRVFCASLADVFDNEVPREWRYDLLWLISKTPNLEWLLVTKRIGNAQKMLDDECNRMMGLPFDAARWPNVRIMVTVVNQEEADRDIPKLLALPCKNGISYEPALGPVDWRRTTKIPNGTYRDWLPCVPGMKPTGIEWIIVGGESSQGSHRARPFNIKWARNTVYDCQQAEIAVFVKQLGSRPFVQSVIDDGGGCLSIPDPDPLFIKDRAGADPSEWPEDLRVQEFP